MIPISNDSEYRVNKEIAQHAKKVRLINDEGDNLGTGHIKKALKRAEKKDLDLVEVAPQAEPPVVKMVDYDQFRYEQQKEKQQQKRNQNTVEMKTLRFKPHIEDHDLDHKLSRARDFLKKKNKVRFEVRLHRRMKSKPEQGEELLERIQDELDDVGQITNGVENEGHAVTMTLGPDLS